jgi:WhiB family transcriptional regulator, redox-sensing transcriptional regulator
VSAATYPLDGAVCEGVTTATYDPFFSETPGGEAEADALAMCSICPVREICLAYAVDTGQMFGVWGGKTQAEIRQLIARARAGRPPARPVQPGHFNADKSHCKHGHPFNAANTYYAANGERRCRACRRARLARSRNMARRQRGER